MRCLLILCLAAAAAANTGEKQPMTPEEIESEDFAGAKKMATIEMNRVSNSANYHTLVGVHAATQQLVAGTLYEFVGLFAETDCENREDLLEANAAKCSAKEDGAPMAYRCSFEVLHQPWVSGSEYRLVNEVTCASPRRPVGGVGTKQPLTPQELQSEAFDGAVKAAEVDFNQNSQLAQLHLTVARGHATKQVVAGVLYEFYGLFAETGCENVEANLGKELGECALSNRARKYQCKYGVLFQPWSRPQYRSVGERDCSVRE